MWKIITLKIALEKQKSIIKSLGLKKYISNQITENQIIKFTKCTKHLLEFAIEGLFN